MVLFSFRIDSWKLIEIVGTAAPFLKELQSLQVWSGAQTDQNCQPLESLLECSIALEG